jgi:hypothetical protein
MIALCAIWLIGGILFIMWLFLTDAAYKEKITFNFMNETFSLEWYMAKALPRTMWSYENKAKIRVLLQPYVDTNALTRDQITTSLGKVTIYTPVSEEVQDALIIKIREKLQYG